MHAPLPDGTMRGECDVVPELHLAGAAKRIASPLAAKLVNFGPAIRARMRTGAFAISA